MATRSSVLRSKRPAVDETPRQPLVGRIIGLTGSGGALIEVSAGSAAVPAWVSTAISAEQLENAAAKQQAALLIFARGVPEQPIVVALLDAARPAAPPLALAQQPAPVQGLPLDVSVDGKRIRIVASEQLVLECGAASITLRSNGRVVVRGTQVETDAQGVNRIKGGTVKIN